MLFHAGHGVLEQERLEGNTFRVGVSIDMPDKAGLHTDDITDTVDYRMIYDVVAGEMQVTSNLIEHVAWRIKQALMVVCPEAREVKVSVAKKNPPVGGEVAWAEVIV